MVLFFNVCYDIIVKRKGNKEKIPFQNKNIKERYLL